LVLSFGRPVYSQEATTANIGELAVKETTPRNKLNVNWLYGAYIPKNALLSPLTSYQRRKLFLRRTVTTPGIYVRTVVLLASIDQAEGSPYEWGGGLKGYEKRVVLDVCSICDTKRVFYAGKRRFAFRTTV
jgi:hypothetical protein